MSASEQAGPEVGVGGVIVHGGKVLLVKRAKEPLRGRWMVPGGTVERGETLEQALVREVREETGVLVQPRDLLLVLERIDREGEAVRFHFVILDYLCDFVSGVPMAASDAEAVALVAPGELSEYDLTKEALGVVLEGFRRSGVSPEC